jgi:hypothetical protein
MDMDMDMGTWGHGNIEEDIETWTRTGNRKRKREAQAIFLNPFTVCTSCKWKFVVCPFVDEETIRSYPFANKLKRLNGLNGLAHLCQQPIVSRLPIRASGLKRRGLLTF